jgi:hypothetical protein
MEVGKQIDTYPQRSGPFRREGFLSCHTVRPAQDPPCDIETSPLPVKGCKIDTYAQRSGPFRREGFL